MGAGDALTSVYVGFVIFAVLGYMAKERGTDVESVATQGQTSARSVRYVA